MSNGAIEQLNQPKLFDPPPLKHVNARPNHTDGSDSHLCVMIGVSVVLSQSQRRGVNH